MLHAYLSNAIVHMNTYEHLRGWPDRSLWSCLYLIYTLLDIY